MKQTAIVTGGSRGIGLAIAKQLGLDGYQVVVFATKPLEACMEHLKELEEVGITWHYISGTIDNREDRKRLVEAGKNQEEREMQKKSRKIALQLSAQHISK